MSLDGYLDAHGGDGALHDKLFIIVCSTAGADVADPPCSAGLAALLACAAQEGMADPLTCRCCKLYRRRLSAASAAATR